MQGWIIVRDNPYFVVTGEDGKFDLHNLPTGKWEFAAWQSRRIPV
jgi:hypothetical protein